MFSSVSKPAHSVEQAIRLFIVLAAALVLSTAPEHAFAADFSLPGLDNVLCGIYTYLAKKILFYVALIVAIVGILAYLLKMDKGVWGTLFVIALLIGIAQGLGSVLSSLGSFDVQCAAIR
jgi:type IV secretory pathway VirB2 component (pilin)